MTWLVTMKHFVKDEVIREYVDAPSEDDVSEIVSRSYTEYEVVSIEEV